MSFPPFPEAAAFEECPNLTRAFESGPRVEMRGNKNGRGRKAARPL